MAIESTLMKSKLDKVLIPVVSKNIFKPITKSLNIKPKANHNSVKTVLPVITKKNPLPFKIKEIPLKIPVMETKVPLMQSVLQKPKENLISQNEVEVNPDKIKKPERIISRDFKKVQVKPHEHEIDDFIEIENILITDEKVAPAMFIPPISIPQTVEIENLDLVTEDTDAILTTQVTDITTDVYTDKDIDELFSDMTVNYTQLALATDLDKPSVNLNEITALNTPAVEAMTLAEPVSDFVELAILLDADQAPRFDDNTSTDLLTEIDVMPLPPITIEVSEAIQVLQITKPEQAEAAIVVLQKISLAVDNVVRLRNSGDETAPEAEEALQTLCIELFSHLDKTLEPEIMMEFIQGIRQTKQLMQVFTDKKDTKGKNGTHEIKHEDDHAYLGLIQDIEDPITRALGTHALRSYQFALA